MVHPDVDSRRGCKGEPGSRWELSVLSIPFYCELESALKNKVHLKEKKKSIGGIALATTHVNAGSPCR